MPLGLRLDLSTDRFDQEYVAKRQRADQKALDDWWQQQLTPPEPTVTPKTVEPRHLSTPPMELAPPIEPQPMDITPQPAETAPTPAPTATTPTPAPSTEAPPQRRGLTLVKPTAKSPTTWPLEDLVGVLDTVLNPPIVQRVIQYVGGKPIASLEEAVKSSGLDPKFIPRDLALIEQMMSAVHGASPVGVPGKPTPKPEPPQPTMGAGRPRTPVIEMPVSEIKTDPERFQYKVQKGAEGATGSLAGAKTFDPNFAGVVQVWTDPADGMTYVVNGHNRLALAKASGRETIDVRHLEADTAEEARTIGAMTNVAEGRGNAIDAAKLFRDTGMGIDEVRARGINLKEKVAADGLALANLADSLFNEVVQGTLPMERALIIGSRVADHDQQVKLVQLMRAKGRTITNADIRELADFVQSAPSAQVTQETLFGAEESTVSLALDKAKIAAAIRERLSTDKSLFGRVGKTVSAERLTEAGNIINVEASQQQAQQSAQLLQIFDHLKYAPGDIGNILNEAATRLHAGEPINAVTNTTYARLKQALPEALAGAESQGLGSSVGGTGDLTTSTGDVITAQAPRAPGRVSEAGVPIRQEAPTVVGQGAFEQPPQQTTPESAPAVAPPPEITPQPTTPEPSPTGREPRPDLTRDLTGQAPSTIEARINLAHFALDDRSLAILDNISRFGEATGTAAAMRRGVVGHAETFAASQGAVTIEELLARQPGALANAKPVNEQVASARQMMANAADYMADLGSRVKAGDPEAMDLYYDAFLVSGQVIDSAKGLVSEVARGLNAAAIETAPNLTRNVIESLQAVRGSVGAENLRQIPVERLVAMVESTPAAKRPDLLKAGIRDMLYEVWINNLLTGPLTHLANITSNTLTTLWAVPVRGLATPRLFISEGEHVVSGEATALMYGAIEGFKDALQMGASALWTGQARFGGLTKLEHQAAITAENLNLTGNLGRAVDVFGEGIGMPGRLLVAEDEFFKQLNFRMELRAQAVRQAAREGLTGKDAGRRVADIVSHPEDYPSIKTAAQNYAFYQTFNQELGGFGNALMTMRNEVPGLGLILPFVRTPTNIAKYSFEHMPLINLAMKGVRDDLKAGGARRDLAMAKTALGGMVMGTIASMAAEGLITGGGPSDPNLRRTWLIDHEPYAVKFPGGSTWYSYNRLDPIGTLFGTAANMAEMAAQIPDADYLQLATAAGIAAGETMLSKTYLRGLGDAVDALRQPEDKARQFVLNWSRSMVPTIIAEAERLASPGQSLLSPPADVLGAGYDKETGKLMWKEVNGVLTQLFSRVPGASEVIEPARNVYGEAIILKSGQWYDLINPVYTHAVRDDPATTEIEQHKVRLTMPAKYFYGHAESTSPLVNPGSLGEGIPLTAKEYDQYVRLAGNELKLNYQGQRLGMHDALNALVASPAYQRLSDGPDGSKADRIRSVVMKYRDAARLTMLQNDPDLKDLVQRRIRARGEAKRPTTAPTGDWRELLGIAR